MKVIVQSKNIEVTQAIRNFVEAQVKRKVTKLNNRIAVIQVYLEHIARKSSDPKRALAKFHVSIPGNKIIVVKSAANNLYDAIVDATDDVARQIRKFKEKRIDKQRAPLVID